MPYHAIQRIALVANTRTAVTVPTDGKTRSRVNIGNATADELRIDMGSIPDYTPIATGGWHDFLWAKPAPHSSPDGISFYATALVGGTMILEWT